jgi:hypothetical protein
LLLVFEVGQAKDVELKSYLSGHIFQMKHL